MNHLGVYRDGSEIICLPMCPVDGGFGKGIITNCLTPFSLSMYTYIERTPVSFEPGVFLFYMEVNSKCVSMKL